MGARHNKRPRSTAPASRWLGITPALRDRPRHESLEPGAHVDRSKLRPIDLQWPDLRHEGACRLLADGVDTRIIQLMLGHATVQQTPRYLNVTDEELRKGLEVSWKRRTLKAVEGGQTA